jgi:hypothetical protein
VVRSLCGLVTCRGSIIRRHCGVRRSHWSVKGCRSLSHGIAGSRIEIRVVLRSFGIVAWSNSGVVTWGSIIHRSSVWGCVVGHRSCSVITRSVSVVPSSSVRCRVVWHWGSVVRCWNWSRGIRCHRWVVRRRGSIV